jgi:ABC-type nitrate/sulfonate/bicarbonate transport system permease component
VRRSITDLATEIWLPIVLVAVWWVWSDRGGSPFWPPLREIFVTFYHTWLFARVRVDLVPSLQRVGESFAIALFLGLTFGVLIGSFRTLRRALEPTLDFIRSIPPAALLPASILTLGIADTQKVFLITFGVVWPILLNTIDGVRGVEEGFHDMSRVYGISRWTRLVKVVLPAASPQIFAGMRISLSAAILLDVFAELYGSAHGLGQFILTAQSLFQLREMWSGIFVIAILAYAANLLFAFVENRVLYWHRGWRASALGEYVEPKRRRSVRASS